MADDLVRPDWPSWYPIRCPAGHPLLPGRIAKHWVNKLGCPANAPPGGDGQGHHMISCETDRCGIFMAPPECTGP